MILCDTNIIIELFKGNRETIGVIEKVGLNNILISSITEMELYFGALNKKPTGQDQEINTITGNNPY